MATILLVDDSPLVLHALARRLEAEGFEVWTEATVTAGRAVDASSLACAAVDIDLPDGSGVALAKALLAARPGLPIAFFTAAGPAGEVADARACGPVFHKPDVDALVAWVKARAQPPPTK